MSGYFDDIEETFLTETIFFFEELMMRIGSSNISSNDFFTWRIHFDQISILMFGIRCVDFSQTLPQ